MEITKQGAQNLWMKMQNAVVELYLKGATLNVFLITSNQSSSV